MRQGTVAFLAGVLALHGLAEIPSAVWAGLGVVGALALARRWPALALGVWFAVGFAYADLHAGAAHRDRLPEGLAGVDLVAEGHVVGLAQRRERSVRFRFAVESLHREGRAIEGPSRIRLSWYGGAPELRPGQRWRLTVRLKPPHGYMNPGGFDYERWLFREGIGASGYVRGKAPYQRLSRGGGVRGRIDRLRGALRERLTMGLPDGPARALVVALAVGERDGISDAQWEVLHRTGTTHLMAISGLHVGLVAGLGLVLGRWLWSRSCGLCRRWPAVKAGAVAGLILATGYALLAGFSVPTRRALIMLVVALGALVLARRVRRGQALAVALLLVVVADPAAVLGAGFWLSFAAVAVILYALGGRWGASRVWGEWGRIQWVAAVGLLPLSLFLFQRASLVAPLANLVAVPWVSLVVVPLVLAGTVTSILHEALGLAVVGVGQQALQWLWLGLDYLADLPLAQWQQQRPPLWTLVPAAVGVALLLAPRGMPGRWLGAVFIAPVFAVTPPTPAPGAAWVTLLDVGQGLSVVVRTARHTLVYDTGPRYSRRFDTGRAVVVPYLRAAAVDAVDRLVISHGDNDHIGGARSVLARMPVREVITGVPGELPGRHCHAAQHWRWDGVAFEFLYPPTAGYSGNEGSCVLRVRIADTAVLIPGDIEDRGEAYLVRRYGERLRASVLVAPHHGSSTSSSPGFVEAVRPRIVLFPVGYRNRYDFPRPAIVARYVGVGARPYASDRHGAVTIRIAPDGTLGPVGAQRRDRRHHWHAPAGRFR